MYLLVFVTQRIPHAQKTFRLEIPAMCREIMQCFNHSPYLAVNAHEPGGETSLTWKWRSSFNLCKCYKAERVSFPTLGNFFSNRSSTFYKGLEHASLSLSPHIACVRLNQKRIAMKSKGILQLQRDTTEIPARWKHQKIDVTTSRRFFSVWSWLPAHTVLVPFVARR